LRDLTLRKTIKVSLVNDKGKPELKKWSKGVEDITRRKLCKVRHYKACELFKTWRRECVMANDVVCSWYILMRGNRDVGDTSNVTSKITSLHKCFIYSNINIYENEE
jgi:hypothetical protein